MPVGVPAPGATAATVAENFSDWPKPTVPVERLSVVCVLAWSIV